MTIPKWVNTERKNHLVKLFLASEGYKCIFGHENCYIPSHRFDLYIEDIISDWKADDRVEASEVLRLERLAMHSLGERKQPIRGRFNNISLDVYHSNQPLYQLEGLGISGLTLLPFAKVKVSSSYAHLYISLGTSLQGISKNRKRKAIRYNKPLPIENVKRIEHLVSLAVREYLK